MAIEEVIKTKISAASGITDIVGVRHYWLKPPQGFTLPMLVWQLSGRARGRETTGLNAKDRSTFQVDCVAETITGARDLADAVITALDGNTGTTSGIKVQQFAIRDESDVYDFETDLLSRTLIFEVAYVTA